MYTRAQHTAPEPCDANTTVHAALCNLEKACPRRRRSASSSEDMPLPVTKGAVSCMARPSCTATAGYASSLCRHCHPPVPTRGCGRQRGALAAAVIVASAFRRPHVPAAAHAVAAVAAASGVAAGASGAAWPQPPATLALEAVSAVTSPVCVLPSPPPPLRVLGPRVAAARRSACRRRRRRRRRHAGGCRGCRWHAPADAARHLRARSRPADGLHGAPASAAAVTAVRQRPSPLPPVSAPPQAASYRRPTGGRAP